MSFQPPLCQLTSLISNAATACACSSTCLLDGAGTAVPTTATLKNNVPTFEPNLFI